MSEDWIHRLKSPRERDFALFLGTQMVERIGYQRWEEYQIEQQAQLMAIFDDFSFFLENQNPPRPNLAAELEARRLLVVQLRIQFVDFVTEVFNLTAGNLQNQNPNGQNNN